MLSIVLVGYAEMVTIWLGVRERLVTIGRGEEYPKRRM
jgi:hypothetical protein